MSDARTRDVTDAPEPGPAHGSALFRLEPDAVRCPHRLFDLLRDQAPVSWIPEIEAYAVTRYDDVQTVLRAPDVFSSAQATGPVQMRQTREAAAALLEEDPDREAVLRRASAGRTPVLLRSDPPLHQRQRSLVGRAFTPRRARESEPVIVEIAESLCDQMADQDDVDLVRAFAVPLPLTVIADRLGVPRQDMDRFKQWSDDFVVAIGNHDLSSGQLLDMLRSQAEFFEYFTARIEQAAAAEPTPDILSDVVHARTEDGEGLSVPEMLGMFSQFLTAGNETTTKLIASGVLRLLEDPELLAEVRADPARIEHFVEETLRLDAPVQGLFRVATRDTEVGGVAIPEGAAVWLVYASANRDDDVFGCPAELDMGRDNARQHLSFGFGEHFCVGAALARLEAAIGLRVLLDRFPKLALSPRHVSEYEPSYVLHGLRALWVRPRG